MTHPASPTVVADDRHARLLQRRLDALVEVGRGSLRAIVATSVFLLAVALETGSDPLGLGLWVLAVVGHACFHESLRARYRQDPHRLPTDQWEALFALGALWTATIIAAWFWAFMPWDEPIVVTMVIAVAVANWVGAAVNLGASSEAFTAYCIAMLLGPIGALLVEGGDFRPVGVMGVPLGLAIVVTHLDLRSQLIERIREREELALLTAQQAAVFDTIAEAVLTVDGGVVGMCNARFLALVGRPRAECVGRPVEEVIPDLARPDVTCDGRPIPVALSATATRTRLHLELRGHAVAGHDDHQVWVCTDVSDRVRREHEMDVLASQDDLTGFLNRRALHERLGREFASSEPPEGLMLVDLDGFKAVNDRHGHAVGDVVLARLATRLRDGLSGVVLGPHRRRRVRRRGRLRRTLRGGGGGRRGVPPLPGAGRGQRRRPARRGQRRRGVGDPRARRGQRPAARRPGDVPGQAGRRRPLGDVDDRGRGIPAAGPRPRLRPARA